MTPSDIGVISKIINQLICTAMNLYQEIANLKSKLTLELCQSGLNDAFKASLNNAILALEDVKKYH